MFKLSAVKREINGVKVRKEGLLPAVLYGGSGETESLSLVPREFTKVYNVAGESSLIDLDVSNKDAGKVLIHDVQVDPVKGQVVHVDFLRVDMNKIITAVVELVYVGESKAIKESGGTLVKNFEEIEIECLPKDLLNHFDIDIAALKTFDDKVCVSDLVMPVGVKIIKPTPESVLVKAVAAMTEDQLKAMDEADKVVIAADKIELADPKKKEDEDANTSDDEEKKEAPVKK